MVNEFIEKTIKMLQRSDIIIHMPEHRKLEFNGELKTIYIEVSEVVGQTQLQDNLIFHLMVFFSIMDTFIDINYPHLEGQSFAKKYCDLQATNDIEIMIKETYRILKILRNASIHSKNAISVRNNNIIIVDYKYKGTAFKLEMSKNCLELIYTLIFFLIKDMNYPLIYKEGLMRTYYDDIKSSITTISDDFGVNNLASISSRLRLKRIVRYKIINPTFIIDSNKQLLTINRYQLHESEKEYSASDYHITANSKCYIIPDEILGINGEISFFSLIPWEINDNV